MHYQSITELSHLEFYYSDSRQLGLIAGAFGIMLVIFISGCILKTLCNDKMAHILNYIYMTCILLFIGYACGVNYYIGTSPTMSDVHNDIQIVKNHRQINHDWYLAYNHYHKHNIISFKHFKRSYGLNHTDNKYLAQIYIKKHYNHTHKYHYIPTPNKLEKLL